MWTAIRQIAVEQIANQFLDLGVTQRITSLDGVPGSAHASHDQGAAVSSPPNFIHHSSFGFSSSPRVCRIKSKPGSAAGIPVLINSDNKLGTTTSSKRFKEKISRMEHASGMLYSLNPVTFRYKKEIDPSSTPQFGLVAEEVEKVNPAFVVRDKEGKPYSVRYDAVNAMLLNEFLKEHKAFLEEQSKVQKLETELASVNERLKEQDAKIEKVSAQLEINKQTATVVQNNR